MFIIHKTIKCKDTSKKERTKLFHLETNTESFKIEDNNTVTAFIEDYWSCAHPYECEWESYKTCEHCPNCSYAYPDSINITTTYEDDDCLSELLDKIVKDSGLAIKPFSPF